MKRTGNAPIPRLASIDRIVKYARRGKDGRHWYRHAADQVRRASAILGIEPQRFADLLALFSPRVSVKRNVRFAVRYAQTGQFAHDVMKGVRSSVDHYINTGEIRGPKTEPFARALLGDGSAIVLDVWMAKAFGVDQALLGRVDTHRECCRRIRIAAKRLGWTPAEVQAAVWSATVREHGRKVPQFTAVSLSLWGDTLIAAA